MDPLAIVIVGVAPLVSATVIEVFKTLAKLAHAYLEVELARISRGNGPQPPKVLNP